MISLREEPEKSFNDLVKAAYSEKLGPNHSWMIRNGAKLAMSYPIAREWCLEKFEIPDWDALEPVTTNFIQVREVVGKFVRENELEKFTE
jgi:hypothetical protein